ncbi:Twin-arginine translocation pathway signal [Apiospora arundinis]
MQWFYALVTFLVAVTASTANNEYLNFGSDETGSPMVHVTIDADKVFADTPANLTGFNIDTGYTNYNETFFHKLAEDLSTRNGTLETKVGAVVSALYGKEYTDSEAEMHEDYDRLFQMAHPASAQALISRNNPFYTWSKGHLIKLTTCAGFLSCISGTTCTFYVTINKAPRSRCENQGGPELLHVLGELPGSRWVLPGHLDVVLQIAT